MPRRLALLAACLLLSACATKTVAASSDAPATSAPATSVDCSDPNLSQSDWVQHCQAAGTQPTVDASGSVTTKDGSFVRYPDGLTVTIGGIVPASADEGADAIIVRELLTNAGTATVDLSEITVATFTADLRYGANGYLADQSAVTEHAIGDLPQRLVPGTSTEVDSLYHLPAAERGTLTFTTSPRSDYYTPYTFTDVQTLLAH